MPPKQKGAAAENKNEAPPAKTIKGEKKIESGEKTSTVSPDQGTTGEPATPKREGTAEKTKQTARRYIFYRCEELSRLLKQLNKKD